VPHYWPLNLNQRKSRLTLSLSSLMFSLSNSLFSLSPQLIAFNALSHSPTPLCSLTFIFVNPHSLPVSSETPPLTPLYVSLLREIADLWPSSSPGYLLLLSLETLSCRPFFRAACHTYWPMQPVLSPVALYICVCASSLLLFYCSHVLRFVDLEKNLNW
jgi:hypothetical protein